MLIEEERLKQLLDEQKDVYYFKVNRGDRQWNWAAAFGGWRCGYVIERPTNKQHNL